MKPDEFWDITWRELDYTIRHKKQEVEREWDVARTLGVWILSPYSKKKLKPSDLLKLEDAPKPSTKEQFLKALEKYGKSTTQG